MNERKKFRDVFSENKDDSLTLLIDVRIKKEDFSKGISFTDHDGLAGVDFHKFRYLDLGGKTTDGVFEILGFYPEE